MSYTKNDNLHLTIGNKMGTARTILLACKNKKHSFNKPKNDNELEKMVTDMTCIDSKSIINMNHAMKPRKTFKEFFKDNNAKEYKSIVQYEWFRNVIYKYYVTNQCLPTKSKLLTQINQIGGPEHFNYTEDKLEKDLKSAGYIWRRLNIKSRAIIAEDPEQLFQRMKYLSNVRNHRLLKKSFVYVSFRIESFSLSVTPLTGTVRVGYKSLTNSDNGEKQTNRELNFIESLIPYLSESCVVILDSTDELKPIPIPNQYSTKQQMMAWLDKHDLQYEENYHTAELYALIDTFKNKYRENCKISDLLKRHGLEVLIVPTELPQLSYFNPIHEEIMKMPNTAKTDYITSVFLKCSIKEYCDIEETLIKEELKIYNEDLQMERVIDKICFAAEQNLFSSQDLSHCVVYEEKSHPYVILD